MDWMNWTLLELLAEQRMNDLVDASEPYPLLDEDEGRQGRGVRAALAGTLVRAGLRLDPSAGERLRPSRLAPARK